MIEESLAHGAGAVGRVDDLPRIEAGAVHALRLWFSGPAGKAVVWNRLAHRFGPREGRARLRALERCLALMVDGARRPIMRHGLACPCLGADEWVLARMFAAAARTDRGGAMLLACDLVRPDVAPAMIDHAGRVAPCLAFLAEARSGASPPRHLVH